MPTAKTISQNTARTTSVSRDLSGDIRVGVIGTGRIGLLHLEALTKAPGITPTICANPTIGRAREGTCRFSLLSVLKFG